VTYGQYARGYSLSFVEPYLLDYRVALGLDLFQREQLANSYISYGTKTLGFSPRLGFACAKTSVAAAALFDLSAANLAAEHAGNCNNNPGNSIAGVQSRRRLTNQSGAWAMVDPITRHLNGSGCGATATAKLRCRSARSCRAARP
jgi:outer membrane protein insertion porin family